MAGSEQKTDQQVLCQSFHYEHVMTRLIDLNLAIYKQVQAENDTHWIAWVCQKIECLSNGRLRLMLEGSYAIPPGEQEIPFPVRYGHRYYGTCYIRADADWGDQPLSLLAAQRLADLCGLILANGEHRVFLHLAQRLVRQVHASSEQVPGLTGTQVNILRLLCSSSTIDEIAQQLTISKKTVERHKENIYKRLGVHNYLELLLVAYWRGYLSPLFSIEEIKRYGEDSP